MLYFYKQDAMQQEQQWTSIKLWLSYATVTKRGKKLKSKSWFIKPFIWWINKIFICNWEWEFEHVATNNLSLEFIYHNYATHLFFNSGFTVIRTHAYFTHLNDARPPRCSNKTPLRRLCDAWGSWPVSAFPSSGSLYMFP